MLDIDKTAFVKWLVRLDRVSMILLNDNQGNIEWHRLSHGRGGSLAD